MSSIIDGNRSNITNVPTPLSSIERIALIQQLSLEDLRRLGENITELSTEEINGLTECQVNALSKKQLRALEGKEEINSDIKNRLLKKRIDELINRDTFKEARKNSTYIYAKIANTLLMHFPPNNNGKLSSRKTKLKAAKVVGMALSGLTVFGGVHDIYTAVKRRLTTL